MAKGPELDFDAYVKRRQSEHSDVMGATGHAYSYVSDTQTRAAFERLKPVEIAVETTVRFYKQILRNQLLGNSVKVGDRQFPRLQTLVRTCAETLQIPQPSVYIVNSPHLNAYTYGTNEESFIVVHSSLVDHLSDEELLTVIGHECGHIHNSHVVYLTALHVLTHAASAIVRWAVEPALVALRAWSRRAEITCDRAGMLCSKNGEASQRALTKLVLGSQRLYDEFNVETFLEQYEDGKEGLGRYMEVFATHPWLPKRVLAMRVFAESELYRKSAGLGPGGLSMKEVDDRVLALLKGNA